MVKASMLLVVKAFSLFLFFVLQPFIAEAFSPFVYRGSFGCVGHEAGQFNSPKDMSFSPDRQFLAVIDTHNNRVQMLKVSRSNNELIPYMIYGGLWPWEERTCPISSYDAYREKDYLSGRTTDELHGRAYHRNQNRTRPARKIPMDRFNLPMGVAWLDNDIFLTTDTRNHRVKATQIDGEVLFILGRQGWRSGYFYNPEAIDVDSSGNIYVTEPLGRYIDGLTMDFFQRFRMVGNRVQIFNNDFSPAESIGHFHGRYGRDYGRFNDVSAVKATEEYIYVVDRNNNRVVIFDKDLIFVKELKTWPRYSLKKPNGIDISEGGFVAISDTENHNVVILCPDYKIVQIIGGFGTSNSNFARPFQARFLDDNNLYVLDTGNNRIQIFGK